MATCFAGSTTTHDFAANDDLHVAIPPQHMVLWPTVAPPPESQKEATLRLLRGPAIDGAKGGRDVFVLLGEVAVRRRIQIGLSGFDYCQVLAGLVEGEEVIISDTAEYLTLPLVAVR